MTELFKALIVKKTYVSLRTPFYGDCLPAEDSAQAGNPRQKGDCFFASAYRDDAGIPSYPHYALKFGVKSRNDVNALPL